MENFFEKTESRTNKPNVLRAFKLGTHLGLVIHWFACLYYMLSEYEGLGSNEWVYPANSTPAKFSKKYITCMFWSVMTLTTIGERPPPQTEVEYIFTGLTFLIGVFVFAAVVGNVGDVISNMNSARRDFQARMDQIKFYMDHRNVPHHLQNRVKRWAEYTWDRTNCIDEPSVLQLLPDRLRTEVAIHVHLDILKKVSIFQDCEEGLLRELVLKLRPQIFSPGDYICRIGEIGRDMYIINHGKVEILFPEADTGNMKQVSVMHPGSFFGEISLLKLDEGQNRRTADVRSLGFSELFCLSRRDLIVALTEYPEAKKILEDYGRERYNKTKRTTNLETDESRPPSPRSSVNNRWNGNKKSNTRSVFERVMKQEGFTKLLEKATKGKEITEIKKAIEEMRAEKKSVKELELALRDKTAELLAAHSQIASLERILISIANPQEENGPGKNLDTTERQECPVSIGRNSTPRWPDLVPLSSQQNERHIGERTSHKTSLHARGYLKEVPTSYAERVAHQSLFAQCRDKSFGPLFVGSRRRIWENSLNFQKTMRPHLLRHESSPVLCNSNNQTFGLRQEAPNCLSNTQSKLDDQSQRKANSCRLKCTQSQNKKGQDVDINQAFSESKTELPRERQISQIINTPSIRRKGKVSLQKKFTDHQNSTSRLLVPCSPQKKLPFSPSVTQRISSPSVVPGCVPAGCDRLQTINIPQPDQIQTSKWIKKTDQVVEGICDATNTLLKQEESKNKILPFSNSQINSETPMSVATENSLTVPLTNYSPWLTSSPNLEDFVQLTNDQSVPPDRPTYKNLEISLSKSSRPSAKNSSLKTDGFKSSFVREQRRQSVSLSLILDNLLSIDSSNSEYDDDYDSDVEDVSDDLKLTCSCDV